MVSLPSGTVTFLFTDVEGSTGLWEEDPDGMRAALELHDRIVRGSVESGGGHVFATGGDGFAVAFSRASDALAVAASAQDALRAQSWPTVRPLRVRMGIHTGEASERDGDYFGPAVNRAARLMAAGHGAQVLVSASTAAVVGGTCLTDLGVHRLRDLAEAQQVFQLGGDAFPALRTLDEARTNLRVEATPLVGRRDLVGELAALVQRERLVTLTGVGGVGKTRLAVEVGAELIPRFPDGVWVVELAPVGQDELVVPALAEVLTVAAQTGEPLITTVSSRIASRRLLVILDNCEHVVGSVARAVEWLTTRSPGLRVLATSREPLEVPGEQVRVVPPLPVETDAVELFVDRAQRAGVTIDSPVQRDGVAEICRRLDGLPLAIELAAARVRMMEPVQIAARLDQRFRLLTGGGRTAVERHRTLQATVAWSYDLLDETDKLLFDRLSVMSGAFDLEAVEGVAGGEGVDAFELLDSVGRLVDKSMVVTVDAEGGRRYQVLETLRQFGAERLAEMGQVAELHNRAAYYWRDRAVAMARRLGAGDHAVVLDAIGADIDNYRIAFGHLLSTGRIDDAARAVYALDTYWQTHRSREGLAWYEQLLGHPELAPSRRLRVLAHAAHIAGIQGDTRSAERNALEAVELAQTLQMDPPWAALYALTYVAGLRADRDAHRQWWQPCFEAAVASGWPPLDLLSRSLRYMWGMTEVGRTEPIAYYEQLLSDTRSHGDPVLIAAAEGQLFVAHYYAGNVRAAQEMAASALEDARAGGVLMESGMLCTVAALQALIGEPEDAASTLRRGMPMSLQQGMTLHVIECAWTSALVAAQTGSPEAARTILAGVKPHTDRLGIVGSYVFSDCLRKAEAAASVTSGPFSTGEEALPDFTLDELTHLAMEALSSS